MYQRFKKSFPICLAVLLASLQVEAAQVVEGADKDKVEVNVSATESNRLSIEGRRITNVVPAQPGLIQAKRDDAQGVLYFTMTPPKTEQVGTLTLFVTDDAGTSYRIVLVPRPVSAEEIVLRPTAAKMTSNAAPPDGRAPSYQRRIKDLIVLMSSEPEDGGALDRVLVGKEIPLWREARLELQWKYFDGDAIGEKYRLTNISRADMLLVEQELFRRGVRGVNIESHTLGPGATTQIYIVRERKPNE